MRTGLNFFPDGMLKFYSVVLKYKEANYYLLCILYANMSSYYSDSSY